ncbi:MAG: family 43 glycosylhydrolase [Prevotellaceae bacterium]|nr:family 43 glycosylhydrolase [Prevotellaceae bacterium]
MRKSLLTSKLLLLTLLALFGFGAKSHAQTALTTSDLTSLYKLSSRKWTSIHDPSVVWDANTQMFYIYGSHYAGAKTKDFSSYTGIFNYYKGGYNSANAYKAFKSNPTHTVKRRLPGSTTVEEVTLGSFDASAFCAIYSDNEAGWVSGDQWAPDIVYNPNMKKWCYYLSLNGDHWASVIVLMTGDSPEGPFTYQAPIIFSGFNGQSYSGKRVNYKDTDLEIVLGTQNTLPSRYNTSQWGTYYPNCIDPCVFFDEEGELWMTHGSWSGGIFILKLDKNTGLRDYTYTYSGTGTSPDVAATSDAYFGKKIAGGAYVSGEGSYIQHIGNYYYLFMSYGGFAPNEGYEMRVFRSENPDGPYKDASGNSAIYSRYMLNFGKNAATNMGMKLIGAMNHWGLMTTGECAQGHNSACQDDLGRTYLVTHTKFNDGTIGHQVRVYQLFLNKAGWLCTAPFQFNGETTTDADIATTQPFSPVDIEGDYHLLIHPYKLDHSKYEEAIPTTVHLTADGRVTGSYTGTWKYVDEGASYFQIQLKPSGSSTTTTYNGVVTEQTLEGSSAKTLCFTSVSTGGVPCWGYKLLPQYAIAYNYNKYGDTYLKSSLVRNVAKNVEIMFDPEENVNLSWTSSAPDVLSNTGKYYAPSERTTFTMTARMECGDYYWENAMNASAQAAPAIEGDQTTGLVAYYSFDDKPTYNLVNSTHASVYYSHSGTGSTPVLANDWGRFGSVLHQYFGAQGTNSYSRIQNPLQGQENLEGFTVSLWVKRSDANLYDALWSFFNSTSATVSGARLYLTGNSYIGFNDAKDNWFDINHPNTKVVNRITVGEWHLVTFTYSRQNGYMLYLDGNEYAEVNLAYTGSTSAADFNRDLVLDFVTTARYFYLGLGSFWGSADACFDDLMIYNRELTATDVKGLSNTLNRVNAFNDGTLVGIGTVTPDGETEPLPAARQGIFDLHGRQVAVPGKGIYIVNGKKVLFK